MGGEEGKGVEVLVGFRSTFVVYWRGVKLNISLLGVAERQYIFLGTALLLRLKRLNSRVQKCEVVVSLVHWEG